MYKYNDFFDAVWATNGDPALIETQASAEALAEIANSGIVEEVLPGDAEEFELICRLLDLGERNNVKRVFKVLGEERAYFCLAEDYANE